MPYGPDSLALLIPLVTMTGIVYNGSDAMGWRQFYSASGPRITLLQAFGIHISSEALVKTIPLGAPMGDSVRTLLLRRACNMSVVEGATGAVVRRFHLGLAQGIFLTIGGVLGLEALTNRGDAAGATSASWLSLSTGLILISVLVFMVFTASSPKLRELADGLAKRLPLPRLRSAMRTAWTRVRDTDQLPAMTRKGILQTLKAIPWFLGAWGGEVFETYVLVLLTGVEASFQQVIVLEAIVSSLRLAAFFLPSGIGVQDIGYASTLTLMGCVASPSDAGTLVVLKRAKDVFWIGLGYFVLATRGIRPFRKSTAISADMA